jgi:hypothetical protein
MTDEAPVYQKVGEEFAGDGTVNPSAEEYGAIISCTRTTLKRSSRFLKRAVYGQFHQVIETHLFRYLGEADFKFNHLTALGYDDADRADTLLRGAKAEWLSTT